MRGHLIPAGRGIILCSDGLQKHLPRRESQTQTQSLIAVISKEPVVGGTQNLPRSHQNPFMSRSTDLKIDLVLALELDFTVVEASGQIHHPVHSNEVAGLESVIVVGRKCAGLRVRLHSHAASPLAKELRQLHYN